MKSLMEEASSISKAIDLAWNRAGKPAQFSVKILEEAERNMFGLTKKSAKIAFFFDERQQVEAHRPTHRPPAQRPTERPTQRQEQTQARSRAEEHQPRRTRPEWTEGLAREATDWVKETLPYTGLPKVGYETSHSGNILKFVFDSSLTGTQGKDRMLFSSFACLIMTTLRQRHKKQLRNLKVLLITA